MIQRRCRPAFRCTIFRGALPLLSQVPGAARFGRCYTALAKRLDRIVSDPKFDQFIILCIVLVGVATVVELESADLSKSPPSPPDTPSGRRTALFLRWTERLTLGVFTAEVVFKLISKGDRPDRYFFDPEEGNWNCFDFLVVVMSFVSNVSIMRLVRLLKVLGKVPALKVLLLGLMAGVSAVSSIMLLMLLIIFLFGIVAVLYFGQNDPAHFGKLERAMLSLFQCATLSGWGEMFLVNFYGCDKYTAELDAPTIERIGVETEYGYLETWGCDRPDRRWRWRAARSRPSTGAASSGRSRRSAAPPA